MEVGNRGYKQSRQWAEDYSAVINSIYQSSEDSPAEPKIESIASQIWLKVAPTPQASVDKLLEVYVFPSENRSFFADTNCRIRSTSFGQEKALAAQPYSACAQGILAGTALTSASSWSLPHQIFCDINEVVAAGKSN